MCSSGQTSQILCFEIVFPNKKSYFTEMWLKKQTHCHSAIYCLISFPCFHVINKFEGKLSTNGHKMKRVWRFYAKKIERYVNTSSITSAYTQYRFRQRIDVPRLVHGIRIWRYWRRRQRTTWQFAIYFIRFVINLSNLLLNIIYISRDFFLFPIL